VIGVAKTPLRTATHAIAVLRGPSARPLYVTAAGMPRADAADLVRHMAGRRRLPDACAGLTPWPATACLSRRDAEQALPITSAHRGK